MDVPLFTCSCVTGKSDYGVSSATRERTAAAAAPNRRSLTGISACVCSFQRLDPFGQHFNSFLLVNNGLVEFGHLINALFVWLCWLFEHRQEGEAFWRFNTWSASFVN